MLIIFLLISTFSNVPIANINLNYEPNYIKANTYFHENPKKAIDYYEETLKLKPAPLVYAKIADCYKRLADLDNAKLNYDKAIELDGLKSFEDSDLYYRYSLFLFELKEYDNALKYIDIAYKINKYESYEVLRKNIESRLNESSDEELISSDEDDWITESDLKEDSFKTSTIFRGASSTMFYQDRVLENGLEDASEFDKNLFLELDYQYSKTTRIMISTKLSWRHLMERNEDSSIYYIANFENRKSVFNYDLEESYFDYKKAEYSLRVGQQFFKWGENTAFSRSDVINPLDLRDSIIPELDKRKVAVFSVTGGYTFKEKTKISLVFIPFRYNPKLSYWGRDFSFLQASKDIDPSIINEFISSTTEDDLQSLGMITEDQKKDLFDSSVAMNLSSSIKSLNLSFVYYYGFQKLPEITMDDDLKKIMFYLLSGVDDQAILAPLATSLANKYVRGKDIVNSKFTRYNHFAFSSSLPVSNFIFKLDLAYTPRRLFYSDFNLNTNVEESEKSFSPIYKKAFDYTLGLEYQFRGDKLLVNLELFGTSILNDKGEDYFYDRDERLGLLSLIKYKPKKNSTIILLANYNFYFKDYLFTFRATKHIGKVDFSIGYNHFGGDVDAPVGRYDKNDEFFIGTKYYF